MTIGSKYQVYNGFAERTSGGLTQPDIVRVKVNGAYRYKSRKQQNKSNKSKSQIARHRWTTAYKEALDELRDNDDWYDKNFLMFKPGKTYSNRTDKELSKGRKLYKMTRAIYDGEDSDSDE